MMTQTATFTTPEGAEVATIRAEWPHFGAKSDLVYTGDKSRLGSALLTYAYTETFSIYCEQLATENGLHVVIEDSVGEWTAYEE